jgi:hypothetical protein
MAGPLDEIKKQIRDEAAKGARAAVAPGVTLAIVLALVALAVALTGRR